VTSPREEITSRLELRRAEVARLDRADARIAWGRLALFAAAALVAWLAWAEHRLSGLWLLAPFGAFVALAVLHDRVLSARARARRAVAFHEAAIARMDGRFAGAGNTGDRFADPAHPYALDQIVEAYAVSSQRKAVKSLVKVK